MFSMLISPALAEEPMVCVTSAEAVDIITLLDASERDIDLLSNCEKLVEDLYKEIEHKDNKIKGLTKELITARQEVIKYKAKNKALRRITWYVAAGGVILITIELLPAVL
jgi:hypothetical protein